MIISERKIPCNSVTDHTESESFIDQQKGVVESESVIELYQAGRAKRAASCSAHGLGKVAADEELALFRFFNPPLPSFPISPPAQSESLFFCQRFRNLQHLFCICCDICV